MFSLLSLPHPAEDAGPVAVVCHHAEPAPDARLGPQAGAWQVKPQKTLSKLRIVAAA